MVGVPRPLWVWRARSKVEWNALRFSCAARQQAKRDSGCTRVRVGARRSVERGRRRALVSARGPCSPCQAPAGPFRPPPSCSTRSCQCSVTARPRGGLAVDSRPALHTAPPWLAPRRPCGGLAGFAGVVCPRRPARCVEWAARQDAASAPVDQPGQTLCREAVQFPSAFLSRASQGPAVRSLTGPSREAAEPCPRFADPALSGGSDAAQISAVAGLSPLADGFVRLASPCSTFRKGKEID